MQVSCCADYGLEVQTALCNHVIEYTVYPLFVWQFNSIVQFKTNAVGTLELSILLCAFFKGLKINVCILHLKFSIT